MQVFDITIEPGKVRLIDVPARYIYFLNGSAGGMDTTIVVRPESGGETVYLKPGQAYEFNPSEGAGTRWAITNLKGEGTILGQLLFAAGRFTDNRVTGSVEVVDGGKARSLANTAFTAAGSPGPAVPGDYPKVQLWNPAGSGKNVFVESATGTSVEPGSMSLRASNVAISTASNFGTPKKMGGMASGARIYTESSPAFGGIPPSYNGKFWPANSQVDIKFIEPIVIPPGYGILAIGAVNTNLSVFFEFFEEPV